MSVMASYAINGSITRSSQTRQRKNPALNPSKLCASRERGFTADWFAANSGLLRTEPDQDFAHVRREDGGDIPDGEYDVAGRRNERRRRWKKWRGEWSEMAVNEGVQGQ